jgi:hypothetical protein
MILDDKNVFKVTAIDAKKTKGADWRGGSGSGPTAGPDGTNVYNIELDFDRAAQWHNNKGWDFIGAGLLAHELGHQFSKAYEPQVGVDVTGGRVWQHDKTAIDWENAVQMPQGLPRRVYIDTSVPGRNPFNGNPAGYHVRQFLPPCNLGPTPCPR